MRLVKRVICLIILCLYLLCGISVLADDGVSSLIGKWVYTHDPSTAVLTLREDGSALYGGEELSWLDLGDALLLEDSIGQRYELRYLLSDKGLVVYLPSLYERISEIGGEGEIIGTWKVGGNSGSSFVFTEDGRFLEDGVFAGTYTVDGEACAVTLHYPEYFQDTVIYYAFSDGKLIIAYPWTLIRG